jgi:hypothetical protein
MKQIYHLIRPVFFLLLFSASSIVAYAQITVSIDSLDAGNFPNITMKIRVMNGTTLLKGLTLGNFTVQEDAVVQNIVAGYCDDTLNTPVSVLLIIDKSGSMGSWPVGSNAIVDAKRSAKSFVDLMSVNDEAALLSFSTNSSYDQSWTSNKTLLKTKIDAITTTGGTSLWDAVITGSTIIKQGKNKRVIIILTDGNDQNSTNSFQTALNAAVASKSIVYTIGLGSNIDVTHLTQLATSTGGKYYNAPSGSDLDQIYLTISQQISSNGFCELRYTSKIDCYNGQEHTVLVQVRYNNQVYQQTAKFRVPYDPSTFSYVTLSMDRDYVVEANDTLAVPVELTQVSTNRPPSLFQFSLDYDTQILQITSAEITPLTQGYALTINQTATGSTVLLSGTKPIRTLGTLLTVRFKAMNIPISAKSDVIVSLRDVQQSCTIVSSVNGQITVSGYCERAVKKGTAVQKVTMLKPNLPNPFNPGTTLFYSVATDAFVRIILFDAIGRQVRTVISEQQKAGEHSLYLDGSDLPTGMYLVKLTANSASSMRRIMLLK